MFHKESNKFDLEFFKNFHNYYHNFISIYENLCIIYHISTTLFSVQIYIKIEIDENNNRILDEQNN